MPGRCGTRSRHWRATGRGARRPHDLEILGPVRIRAHHQRILAEQRRMVLDVILDLAFARRDQGGRRVRIGEIEQPRFGGFVIVDRDVGEAARLRLRDRHEEAGPRLLVNEGVVLDRRREPVAKNARGPVIAVEPHVIEGGRVARPNDRTGRIRHHVGEIVVVNEIADADRVEFRACLVGRPGEQAVIGGMTRAAELEIGLAVGECVAVQQHLLGAARAPLTADDRMLSAFAIADVVSYRGRRAPARSSRPP